MTEQKLTILLVEDDNDIREQMKLWFERENYKVLDSYSQKETEKIIKNEKFDVAVLDLMLENRDSGFILAHKIKKINSKIPVFIVTAANKETEYNFSVNSKSNRQWIKADAILNKGIRPEQIIGLIKEKTERK